MKNISLLLIILIITSCGSSGRVCGGSGGKRCVETTHKINADKIS